MQARGQVGDSRRHTGSEWKGCSLGRKYAEDESDAGDHGSQVEECAEV